MSRLYSDLLSGSGQRYYFGLNTAPGGITNATPATLTLFGNLAVVQEQSTIFRTPATALLTLTGYAASGGLVLQPNIAALSIGGLIPGEQRIVVITNALPPDYATLPDNAPTILYIQTISPPTAALTLLYPSTNLTQGGNIGFASPGVASLTLNGQIVALPRLGGVGLLSINGLVPTLLSQVVISPDLGALVLHGLAQELVQPFHWIDDDPAPSTTWIDDPPA